MCFNAIVEIVECIVFSVSIHCKHSFEKTTHFFVYIPSLRNNVLYFLKHRLNFLKKELILISSSSDSEEDKKSVKIYLGVFFSMYKVS